MKIIIIIEFFPDTEKGDITGGVEARAFNITKRLAEHHDITILTSRRPNQLEQTIVGKVRVIRVGLPYAYSNSGSIFRRITFIIAALRRAMQIDFDIIEGYSFLGYIPSSLAAKLKGRKSIATYHECWVGEWIRKKGFITGTFGEIWERLVLMMPFDRIITVSNTTRDAISRLKKTRVEMVHNGVDNDLINSIKIKKDDEKTVCSVSRLIPQKRVDILLQCIALLKKENIIVKSKIVCDGPEKERLHALSRKLGIDNQVRWLGFIPRYIDVMKVIKSSQVLFLPSEQEGFGIVAVEAMACGTIPICADIPPLREVSNGNAAVLVHPGDIRGFASALKEMFTNKKKATRVLELGRKRARQFSWDDKANEIEKIYFDLIKEE